VDDEDRKRTWMADADECKSRGSIETARAIYAHALTIFPSKRPMFIVSLRGSHIRHSIHLLFTPRRVLKGCSIVCTGTVG
jgi:hypothetical protein